MIEHKGAKILFDSASALCGYVTMLRYKDHLQESGVGGVRKYWFLAIAQDVPDFIFSSRNCKCLEEYKYMPTVRQFIAGAMAGSSDDDNYELVRAQEVGSSSSASADDNIGTKPTLRLPPKLLPRRRHRDFALSLVTPTLITIFSLAALSALLSQLWRLLPDIEMDGEDMVISTQPYLHIAPVPASPISCDLITANASAFEKVFTIDLRSQLQLSFATAKFIDVVWDLVVGPGGRLLLVWISYIVFVDGLARLMEASAVSYQLYALIMFETSSLISTCHSFKAVSTGDGWRGRAFFAWFGLATMYVLGYSTLISAATGYINRSNIRYRMEDNSLITPDSEHLTHCLQIINEPALGLKDICIIPGPSDKELDGFVNHMDDLQAQFPLYYKLLTNPSKF